MFGSKLITKSTEDYSVNIERLREEIHSADAILVGAGAGLSTSAGFTYSGERFENNFANFRRKYGFSDMYSGGFYPYASLEEYWAWWSRYIWINRYTAAPKPVYDELFSLVKDKDYFVLTTNVDHQFQKAGFDKNRLFYTQGDYCLWQCANGCGNKTFDNEEKVRQMVAEQKDMKIPTELIPRCPFCKEPMTMNLRCDDSFVQDDGWYDAAGRYEAFLKGHENRHVLFLELGVGFNTPGIIKFPFFEMTAKNGNAVYATVNLGEAYCPAEIQRRSICIDKDIGLVLNDIL